MRGVCAFAVILIGFSCLWFDPADAQGLLGKRYAGVEVGLANVTDNDVQRSIGGGVRVPLHKNIDVVLGGGYGIFERNLRLIDLDFTSSEVNLGSDIHFSPEGKADPYIGVSFFYFDSSVTPGGWGFSGGDDAGITVGGGFEYDIGEDSALTPSFDWSRLLDYEENSYSIGLALNHWVSGRVGGGVDISYEFTEHDYGANLGLFYGF